MELFDDLDSALRFIGGNLNAMGGFKKGHGDEVSVAIAPGVHSEDLLEAVGRLDIRATVEDETLRIKGKENLQKLVRNGYNFTNSSKYAQAGFTQGI